MDTKVALTTDEVAILLLIAASVDPATSLDESTRAIIHKARELVTVVDHADRRAITCPTLELTIVKSSVSA